MCVYSEAIRSLLSRKNYPTVWCRGNNIPIDDTFFIKWNQTLFKIVTTIQKYDGKDGVTEKSIEMLWGGIFASLYIDYITQEDFHQQFENNISKLLGVFDGLEKIF